MRVEIEADRLTPLSLSLSYLRFVCRGMGGGGRRREAEREEEASLQQKKKEVESGAWWV